MLLVMPSRARPECDDLSQARIAVVRLGEPYQKRDDTSQ